MMDMLIRVDVTRLRGELRSRDDVIEDWEQKDATKVTSLGLRAAILVSGLGLICIKNR